MNIEQDDCGLRLLALSSEGQPAARLKDARRRQWQFALPLLASGIVAFCAGSRAAPRLSSEPPRPILAAATHMLKPEIRAQPVPARANPHGLTLLASVRGPAQLVDARVRAAKIHRLTLRSSVQESVLLEPLRLNASLAGSSLPRVPLAGAYPQFATGLGVRIYDGTNAMLVDPCKGQTKLYTSINQTANTQLVAGTASKKIYVCSIHLVVAAATNVALVEGTGSVCGTGTSGVSGFGGATAATGWNFAANGGIAFGNGDSSLGAEGTSGDNLCLFNSGSGQVSGGISYVVQ